MVYRPFLPSQKSPGLKISIVVFSKQVPDSLRRANRYLERGLGHTNIQETVISIGARGSNYGEAGTAIYI
jgi:hypothetical protein